LDYYLLAFEGINYNALLQPKSDFKDRMARDLEEYLQEISEMEKEARQERDRFFIE